MDSKIWKESYNNSFLQFLHCKIGVDTTPQPKHDLRKQPEKVSFLPINHTLISPVLIVVFLMIVFIVLMKILVGVSATGDTIQHIEAII